MRKPEEKCACDDSPLPLYEPPEKELLSERRGDPPKQRLEKRDPGIFPGERSRERFGVSLSPDQRVPVLNRERPDSDHGCRAETERDRVGGERNRQRYMQRGYPI